MARAAAMLGVLLLAGCARESSIYLPLPPHQGARAIVIAAEHGGSVAALAHTVDAQAPAFELDPSILGSGGTTSLYALVYDSPLQALRIPEGALPPAAAADLDRGPLPAERALFRTELALEGSSVPAPWEMISSRSSGLAGFEIALAPAPCAELDVELYQLESIASAAFVVALDATRALVGLDDGQYFVIDRSGAATKLSTATRYYFASGLLLDGQLWLGGVGLARAELRGGALEVSSSTRSLSGQQLNWLAGRTTARGPELLTLSHRGELELHRGGVFRSIHAFTAAGGGMETYGGLASVADDEWVAGFVLDSGVVRVKGGLSTSESLPGLGATYTVAQIPGLGTVAGTGEGRFLASGAGGWRDLGESGFHLWVGAILPYEDGFVFGGSLGNFGQYKESYGFCPGSLPVNFHLRYMAVLGEDVLLVSPTPPGSTPTPYALLRRRR